MVGKGDAISQPWYMREAQAPFKSTSKVEVGRRLACILSYDDAAVEIYGKCIVYT